MPTRRELPDGTIFRYFFRWGITPDGPDVRPSKHVYRADKKRDVPHPPNPWAGISAATTPADLDAEVEIVETATQPDDGRNHPTAQPPVEIERPQGAPAPEAPASEAAPADGDEAPGGHTPETDERLG
jgi:hypothetical protein